MSILICPNCGTGLSPVEGQNTLRCEQGHCFDLAKEGYVNLMVGSRSGENRGDSKASARSRKEFLSKDYYRCLKEAIGQRITGTVLDICCGEGYYDEYDGELYGFDLSKEMVRLASKRWKQHHYFVANLFHIPVADHSIDTAVHLFAPFCGAEFARVLQDDGVLYSVIPGERHLFEMKELLYETPYVNDEEAPTCPELSLVSRTKVSDRVLLSQEDLKTCFSMTPYYYHTSEADRAKLDTVDSLTLTVEFVILEYRKR